MTEKNVRFVLYKNHFISLYSHRDCFECDACDRSYRDGYACSYFKFKFNIHMRCAFVFMMKKIREHPSHDGHHVKLLLTGAPDGSDPNCHICGKYTKLLLYHCSTCNLNLDIDCMFDAICARSGLNLSWHAHTLLEMELDNYLKCEICGFGHERGYFCARCRLMVHEKCVNSIVESTEITHHPCHAKHSLKLLLNGAPDYTNLECHLCGEVTKNLLYHCDICKFNLDPNCAIHNPPPVGLSNLKVHEHTVKLMPKLITFVCDACGIKGDRAPYVCHQCDITIHQKCAHLPHVIYVNRHDHRVSYTYPLGPGKWKCGVCWEEIDWSCGAYSCSLCSNYVVHSRCATRLDVWDGKELDGVLEENENINPFKVNDDGTITHFAHEHNLSPNKDGTVFKESILCSGCVRPIDSNIFYDCSDCSFILHKACANLPLRKRHFVRPKPLALKYCDDGFSCINECLACSQYFGNGFMYVDGPFTDRKVDLACISVTDPFTHGSHPHPLLYTKMNASDKMITTCQSCGIHLKGMVLGCTECKFYLEFRCATLPSIVVLNKYDDHPLTLFYGEKASGKYWCDICESETSPETWFYTCKDCGVTLHILCVLGDLRYVRLGQKFKEGFTFLPNSSSSRPICNACHCHCPGPFTLTDDENNIFFCSFFCLTTAKWWRRWQKHLICPPWIDEQVVLIHNEERRKTQEITEFCRSKSI